MTIRSSWIANPDTLSIAPTAIADVRESPTRWKNRISSAMRAAELGTASWMNQIAYWSISTGPNLTGRMHAPIVEKDCATPTNGTANNAAINHGRSALRNSSTRVSSPTFDTAESARRRPGRRSRPWRPTAW